MFAPAHFNATEFAVLFGLNLLSALALFMLFGAASFANVLFICFIISSYILPVKMVFSILEKSRKLEKEEAGNNVMNAGRSCFPGDLA